MVEEKRKPAKGRHFCPFCDEEIAKAAFPYCKACKVDVLTCPECHEPVPRDEEVCPHCGCDIREEAGRGG
jgi:hypothetical protein